MDNNAKMAALLRTLRAQTNGAVVGAMQARGVDYPLSYGVAAADIRKAAATYAPDHPLALLLYRQPVRELRLAAAYIADPQAVRTADAAFWAEGITCGEVAEHLAGLVARSPDAEALVTHWLASPAELPRYAALMAGARAAMRGLAAGWDFGRMSALMASAAGGPLTHKGIAAITGHLWAHEPASHTHLRRMADGLRTAHPALYAELEWHMGQP